MSGDIFQPMEGLDESGPSDAVLNGPSVDDSSLAGAVTAIRNPLLCYLCNRPYEDPRIFSCFHSFCANCLKGRANDGKMTCPLCGLVYENYYLLYQFSTINFFSIQVITDKKKSGQLFTIYK